ncbi:MAG: hypothetical protein ACOYN3_05220 [Acidimicrobiia bacterium]
MRTVPAGAYPHRAGGRISAPCRWAHIRTVPVGAYVRMRFSNARCAVRIMRMMAAARHGGIERIGAQRTH